MDKGAATSNNDLQKGVSPLSCGEFVASWKLQVYNAILADLILKGQQLWFQKLKIKGMEGNINPKFFS